MSDMAIELPIRPITVDEYHRMAEAGIIEEDERVELLDGMLVEMPPIGRSHILAHTRIVRYLIERFGREVAVAGQAAIPLTPTDEPQPDITLFRPEALEKGTLHWTSSDVVALLEIAASSLHRDAGPKMRAYARGNVSEYLIVDLSNERIIRHREPRGEKYVKIDELPRGAEFALEKVPARSLNVTEFFERRP